MFCEPQKGKRRIVGSVLLEDSPYANGGTDAEPTPVGARRRSDVLGGAGLRSVRSSDPLWIGEHMAAFCGLARNGPSGARTFFALRPVQRTQAAPALCCRLLEAALGILATLLGLASVRVALQHSAPGINLLAVADWNQRTLFGAFIFTVGSTIFFGLFVASRYIPRWLAWLGLLASVVAFAAGLAHLVRPSFPAMTAWAWIPMLIAEPLTGGWLLVKSVRVRA